MKLFNDLIAIATLITIIYASYIYFFMYKNIPSFINTASEINSPLFAFAKFDLTEQNHINWYNEVVKIDNFINEKRIIMWGLRFYSPIEASIIYVPNKVSKIDSDGINFVMITSVGRGEKFINYYLFLKKNTVVPISTVPEAKIYFDDNETKQMVIGTLDNIIILGFNINSVKKTIIKIDKTLSKDYQVKKNNFYPPNMVSANLYSIFLNAQMIKKDSRMLEEFKDIPLFKDLEKFDNALLVAKVEKIPIISAKLNIKGITKKDTNNIIDKIYKSAETKTTIVPKLFKKNNAIIELSWDIDKSQNPTTFCIGGCENFEEKERERKEKEYNKIFFKTK